MDIGIREAKSDLSRLIEFALSGQDVVITKRGKPLVRLVPEKPQADAKRGRGFLKDIILASGWDSRELDDEIAATFEACAPLLVPGVKS